MESNKPYQRNERVSELIRKELGELILRQLEFPGAIMTIVDVEVTKKIDYARIHCSVIPSSKSADVLRTLQMAKFRLQGDLLRKINIRPMPDLSFIIDHGTEKAADIEKIMIDNDLQNPETPMSRE
jgi:ribosome-binding factor A